MRLDSRMIGVTCEAAKESLPGRPSQHWLLLYAPFQLFPDIGQVFN
jgi:hypothetical protein